MPLKAELWRTHPKYHCDAGAFPSLPAASHVDLKSEPAFSRSVDEFSANGNAADVFCQRKCCASRYTDYEREKEREREREREVYGGISGGFGEISGRFREDFGKVSGRFLGVFGEVSGRFRGVGGGSRLTVERSVLGEKTQSRLTFCKNAVKYNVFASK